MRARALEAIKTLFLASLIASCQSEILPSTQDAGAGSGDGWYYDDNTSPTQLILCPDTCAWAQGLTDAKLSIGLGCLSPIK